MGNISRFDYKVINYINNHSELKNFSGKVLWDNDPQTKNYAQKVANSTVAQKSLGKQAVFAYGELYTEKSKDTKNFNLVDLPCEYYFTDMVFIQQRYEEVVIDLLFLKSEDRFIYKNSSSNVDTLITKTLRIAKQNGVNIDQKQLLEKFATELNKHVVIAEQQLNLQLGQFFPAITPKYSQKIAQAIKEYYLDPNNETYNNLKNSFLTFLDVIKKESAVYVDDLKINNLLTIADLASVAERKSGLYLPYFDEEKNQ